MQSQKIHEQQIRCRWYEHHVKLTLWDGLHYQYATIATHVVGLGDLRSTANLAPGNVILITNYVILPFDPAGTDSEDARTQEESENEDDDGSCDSYGTPEKELLLGMLILEARTISAGFPVSLNADHVRAKLRLWGEVPEEHADVDAVDQPHSSGTAGLTGQPEHQGRQQPKTRRRGCC